MISPANSNPLVSVVMPVLNERASIESVLVSILSQRANSFEMELILVDGGSTDGTLEVVRKIAAYDQRLRLVHNPKRRTPIAFNLGIAHACGQYICILGAHTEYASDYISTCLAELERTDAAGCSGGVITVPANVSLEARLVAMAMSSKFGSSSGSFRTQREGFVDSIPYPLFRAELLRQVGGYDESLTRNQDNDLNQRLRERGHKLFLTKKTCCWYRAQASVKGLIQYAFRNGYWNAISIRTTPKSMSPRHLIPGVFAAVFLAVLALCFLHSTGAVPYWAMQASAAPFVLYAILASCVSVRQAISERCWAPLLLPQIFLLFHLAYGSGTLWGLASGARAHDLDAAARRVFVEPVG